MAYYVVEAPHEAEEHGRAVAETLRMSRESQLAFLWGCRTGVHKPWAFIEADGRGEALDVLPAFLRSRASVHRVEAFTARDVESLWEQAA